MTDADAQKNDAALVEAVERYLLGLGWQQSDLMLTDVLVVTVRNGFDQRGRKSLTSVMTPTDSAVPVLIGMSRYASLRFEQMAVQTFRDNEPE